MLIVKCMLLANTPEDKLLRKFSVSGKNPYQFVAHQSRPEAKQRRYRQLPHERTVSREQQLTIFENDEAMRRMFKNDFEDYMRAIDNPDLMIQRMNERMAEIERDIEQNAGKQADFDSWWQDEFFIDDMDEITSSARELEDEEFGLEWEKDPLYEKANKWAHRLHKVGLEIYEKQNRRDKDLYRVMINVFMVPAKIAFASSGEGDYTGDAELDAIEAEISLKGYNMCMIFLRRARESLLLLAEKNFIPAPEWQAAVLGADEIAFELQGRIIAVAKIINKGIRRGDW